MQEPRLFKYGAYSTCFKVFLRVWHLNFAGFTRMSKVMVTPLYRR